MSMLSPFDSIEHIYVTTLSLLGTRIFPVAVGRSPYGKTVTIVFGHFPDEKETFSIFVVESLTCNKYGQSNVSQDVQLVNRCFFPMFLVC